MSEEITEIRRKKRDVSEGMAPGYYREMHALNGKTPQSVKYSEISFSTTFFYIKKYFRIEN